MRSNGTRPAIRLPNPHPGQRTVLRQMKRFNWLSAGRRWRKTTLGLHPAVDAMLKGQIIIWGAPTYDQVRIGMGELKQALGGYAEFNQGRMTAIMPGGGTVYFRSLDNADNVRGYTADGVIMDEIGFIKRDVWWEVLRPMLIDTGGWSLGKGTPNGRNWFWVEYQNAQDQPDAMRWQVPTLGVKIESGRLVRAPHPLENTNIEFDEIERLYRTLPERIFRQEILAEFIEDGGGVFRRVMEAATVEPIDRGIPGQQYIFGVDWAQSVDFTVFIVVDVEARRVVAMDRFNQIDYTVQRGRLMALFERFRPDSIITEANAMGQPIIDQLKRDGLPVVPFTTTNATKAAAIDALALAFERSTISIPNDPVLIGELQAYEMGKTKTGLRTFSAPDGMHDDCVMALAIAWSGMDLPATTGMRQGKVTGRGASHSGRGRATAVRRNGA